MDDHNYVPLLRIKISLDEDLTAWITLSKYWMVHFFIEPAQVLFVSSMCKNFTHMGNGNAFLRVPYNFHAYKRDIIHYR